MVYYDTSILPKIVLPFSNERKETTKYLGGRALTGEKYASLNINMKNDTEAKQLYDFWKDDCNYGALPFELTLPLFGEAVLTGTPNVAGRFLGDFSQKITKIGWKTSIKIKIVELGRENVTNDAGELVTNDAGDVVYTNIEASSIKEITYG